MVVKKTVDEAFRFNTQFGFTTEQQVILDRAMAKRFVTNTGLWPRERCVRAVGRVRVPVDYGIEKIVRGLRVHQIVEGTQEIMWVILAQSLAGNSSRLTARGSH